MLQFLFVAIAPIYAAPADATLEVEVAEMGLGGIWKVGYSTQARIIVRSGQDPIAARIELQTFDGDGVSVIYRNDAWRANLAPNSTAQVDTIVKHGRANRPITVRLLNDREQLIYERQLTESERGVAIPATQPWIVGIGSENLKLGQASMKSARGALPEYTTVQLTEAKQLPVSSRTLEGVDLLVLSSRNESLNEAWSETNAVAIRDWIMQGGRCLLSIGSHAPSWCKQKTISSLIPGVFEEVALGCERGPLESYVGSQAPFSKLNCAVFTLTTNNIDLSTQTATRTRFPLVARWSRGAGKIVFLATELDCPEMLEWESRPALLKLLFDEHWEKKNVQTDKLLYQGYDDLSGQLNATLDDFPQLTMGNLTSISIIAGLLCLIIGPFDYFVISRAWRRPRVTWITLLFCSIGSCFVIGGLTQSWKPDTPSLNCMELVDIDFQTRSVIGRGFARCYGGLRGEFDFSSHRRLQSINSQNSTPQSLTMDWLGQPGKGLGGFDSSVATDRGMPVYYITAGHADKADGNESDGPKFASQGIQGVGIPFAGTKAFSVSWNESIDIASDANSLSVVPGTIDLLEGSFTNTLATDLLDAMLIYRGRGYTLPTRIREGETLTFSPTTVPKDITRRLQRRQNVSGQEKSTPWNPGDTSKLGRLVELISFHRSATGSNYTGLYNRYLCNLDISEVVKQDRAILFAELKDSTLTWSIRRNGLPIQAAETKRKTFVRLILPVSKLSSQSSDSVRSVTPKSSP